MIGPSRITAELRNELEVAERKAWEALSRYKFQMFGYWAAIWVHLNRVGGFRQPNPWSDLVLRAKVHRPTGPPEDADAPLF